MRLALKIKHLEHYLLLLYVQTFLLFQVQCYLPSPPSFITLPSAHSSVRQSVKTVIDVDLERKIHLLTESDPPHCQIEFRKESNSGILYPKKVDEKTFILMYNDGEIPSRDRGNQYLAKIFNNTNSRVPPYVQIECWSTYIPDFTFEGVGSIQFERAWRHRVRPLLNKTKIIQKIGVQVLVPPSATGQYIVHLRNNTKLRTSFFIFSETDRAPFLLDSGKSKLVNVDESGRAILPCTSSNYDTKIFLYKKSPQGQYISILNTNKSVFYNPKIGYILENVSDGEYRCTTGSSDDADYVDISVVSRISKPKDSTSMLTISIVDNGAICSGPAEPALMFAKFDANPTEIQLLTKCLQQRNRPCGQEFRNRVDGMTIYCNGRQQSIITGFSATGHFVCFNENEAVTKYYFTGLDGQKYINSNGASSNALLYIDFPWLGSSEAIFGGSELQVRCKFARGWNYNGPRYIYARNMNGSVDYLGEVQESSSTPDSTSVWITSKMTSIICDDLAWEGDTTRYIEEKIKVEPRICKAWEFQCSTSEECLEKRKRCDGYFDCQDKSDEQNCHEDVESKCEEFTCKGDGRCLEKKFVCDGLVEHCYDGSDESPEICSNIPSNAPRSIF